MNTASIPVGLVGCGNAGRNIHVRLLRRYDDAYTIVSCADVNPAAAKALADDTGIRAAASVEALVADPSVELIVVATKPPSTHRDVALMALDHGKHVVVEKPMAGTPAECTEMIEAAERAGRILTVHHNRRWDVDFLTARAVLASGELGDPRLIRNEYTAGFSGTPYDWAIHLVDQTMSLSSGARFTELSATFCKPTPDSPLASEGFFSARLRTDSGVVHDLGMLPSCTGNAYLPGAMPVRFVLVGTEGVVYQQWCQRPEDAFAGRAAAQLADADRRLAEQAVVKAELAAPDFYQLLHAAVRDGGPAPVPATEGRRAVAAWELICRSAAKGRALEIDL